MEGALCSPLALSPNHVFNVAQPGTLPRSLSFISFFFYFLFLDHFLISFYVLLSKRVHILIAVSFVIAGDKNFPFKYSKDRSIVMTVAASRLGKGGGLLERPTIEKTSPGRESEFDLR